MEKFLRSKFALVIVNTILAATFGGILFLNNAVKKYVIDFSSKPYIAVFTSKTWEVIPKIRALPSVRKAEIFNPQSEVLKESKELLKEIPSAIKVFPQKFSHSDWLATSQELKNIPFVEEIDDGGEATREIFLFFEKVRSVATISSIIIFILTVIAFFEEKIILSEIAREDFFSRRGLKNPMRTFKNIIYPIIATPAAVLFLLAIHQTFFPEAAFLSGWHILAMAVVSFLPLIKIK